MNICPKHGCASTCGICEACADDAYEPQYARKYAVACIAYYGNGESIMSDAQFDGFCSWLLGRDAWRRVPYLERGMLIAGSGYDLAVFPPELHEAAAAILGHPCRCQICSKTAR